MEVCRNCGYSLETPAAVCPNCGYYPKPNRSGRSLPDWALVLLGFISAFGATIILPFLGALFMAVVYFSIKEKYPAFAQGLGYGLITLLVLLLGAVALCFAAVFGGMFKF